MIILFCWFLLLAMTVFGSLLAEVRYAATDGGPVFIPAVDTLPAVGGLLAGATKAVFKWPIPCSVRAPP